MIIQDNHGISARSIAKAVARGFRGTLRGRAWEFATEDTRRDIVDALVMDQVRGAWSADSNKAITPSELMTFRDMLVEELAAKGFKS